VSWLDKLEKRWRPFTIPNLTVILIFGQFLVYALARSKPEILERIVLVPALVMQGEVWRLLTFVFHPPLTNAIFIFFAWYLFYLMGDALENQWGATRYNVFLWIAYLATVAVSFLAPYQVISNGYLGGSVFLAFAYLFPDFQIYLFFILPVKVKWLALLTWIGYFLGFAFGGWSDRLLIMAAVANFLLFFGRDVYHTMRSRKRRMEREMRQIRQEHEPVHRCEICGKTDKSHPGTDFRYCSKCVDTPCYCEDHIRDHEHRTAEDAAAPAAPDAEAAEEG